MVINNGDDNDEDDDEYAIILNDKEIEEIYKQV